MDGRLIMSGRDQQTSAGVDAEPQDSRRIKIGEEDERVEGGMVAFQIVQQCRAPRPLLFQPLDLVGPRMRILEDPVGVLVESFDLTSAISGEPTDRHPSDAIGSRLILVSPRNVIASAGRKHLDVMARRELLGNEPAVIFRTAQNLGAVSLNDECEFH